MSFITCVIGIAWGIAATINEPPICYDLMTIGLCFMILSYLCRIDAKMKRILNDS